jgi:alkylated DNA repair dioxygenase AlkB
METPIRTENSFLKIYKREVTQNLDLDIEKCVKEVKDKLLNNPPIVVYGKPAKQHRSIGFFSNDSIGYYYSGQLAKSQPLTPKLKNMLNIINNKLSAEFNGILVNYYKNGEDYIGKHSDDEKGLDKIGVVSISYGAIRKFRIRNKLTNKKVIDINMNSGEIIHMGGNFQKEFTHEIPIEKKIKEGRYSFTLRNHLI